MVEGLTLYQAQSRSAGSQAERSRGILGSRSILCAGARPASRFGGLAGAAMYVCIGLAASTAPPSARGVRRWLSWTARDGAAVARRAHNPKVGGSNPSPATRSQTRAEPRGSAFALRLSDERLPHGTAPSRE